MLTQNSLGSGFAGEASVNQGFAGPQTLPLPSSPSERTVRPPESLVLNSGARPAEYLPPYSSDTTDSCRGLLYGGQGTYYELSGTEQMKSENQEAHKASMAFGLRDDEQLVIGLPGDERIDPQEASGYRMQYIVIPKDRIPPVSQDGSRPGLYIGRNPRAKRSSIPEERTIQVGGKSVSRHQLTVRRTINGKVKIYAEGQNNFIVGIVRQPEAERTAAEAPTEPLDLPQIAAAAGGVAMTGAEHVTAGSAPLEVVGNAAATEALPTTAEAVVPPQPPITTRGRHARHPNGPGTVSGSWPQVAVQTGRNGAIGVPVAEVAPPAASVAGHAAEGLTTEQPEVAVAPDIRAERDSSGSAAEKVNIGESIPSAVQRELLALADAVKTGFESLHQRRAGVDQYTEGLLAGLTTVQNKIRDSTELSEDQKRFMDIATLATALSMSATASDAQQLIPRLYRIMGIESNATALKAVSRLVRSIPTAAGVIQTEQGGFVKFANNLMDAIENPESAIRRDFNASGLNENHVRALLGGLTLGYGHIVQAVRRGTESYRYGKARAILFGK